MLGAIDEIAALVRSGRGDRHVREAAGMTTKEPICVVLAGGSGTRLWPASRRDRPKFLIDVGDGEPMLTTTLRRAVRVTRPDLVWVVTGADHAAETRAIAEPFGARVVIEPAPRDTAAALLLVAMLIEQRHPGSIAISMPADHRISDPGDAWPGIVRTAAEQAGRGLIACVVVPARQPDTGLGYVHARATPDGDVLLAEKFHEKPDLPTARGYLESGMYFWNTAIMAWAPKVFITAARAHASRLAAQVTSALHPDGSIDAVRWQDTEVVAVEPAVIEPAAAQRGVSVVPADFDWTDVGTWATVAGGLPSSEQDVITLDCRPPVVYADRRQARRYAVVGLDDLIVVECDDVVLITDKYHAADVKRLVADLPRQNGTDLL
ncbi:sugar phosphate nucleotidyltransferase [Nocardia gipuzkoensis]|uniref:sugar phosphate nucleotidyltransferase n=1 Tax=Nocardia gipuzkoensis TaxID=2749991 RepID=UPI0030B85B75